jgi:hypothetical protein
MSDDRYARAEDVLWRRAAGGIMLLPLADPEIFELRGSGVYLWEALAEPTTLTEISRRLAERFDTTVEVVASDVENTLVELLRRGVVTKAQKT